MFGKQQRKWRKQAGEYADQAAKVLHYRRDQLAGEAIAALAEVRDRARERSRDRGLTREQLEGEAAGWDATLRAHGGRIHPKTFWTDNVETFLVAAIIVLGIRAFFLQPFIIPTNSMAPTYSGMHYEIFEDGDAPLALVQPLRFLFLGARSHSVEAAGEGPVRLPLELGPGGGARPAFSLVEGRKFGFVPATRKEYRIAVGADIATFRVPVDFNADRLLRERFFPESDSWSEVIREQRATGRLQRLGGGRAWLTVPGESFQPGETVLRFDLLSGDALFVDRFSYHFVRPEPGDPIVFRTGNIEGMRGPRGEPVDKYYIKRLAGTGGDSLTIHAPALFRNGEPALGNVAFRDNAQQIHGYPGYVPEGWLAPGRSYEVPGDGFFVLGDNSPNSLDSRYWGPFDPRDTIGRALWIYYPFSQRWGPAH